MLAATSGIDPRSPRRAIPTHVAPRRAARERVALSPRLERSRTRFIAA
jgi:hypothetical protein